MQMKSMLEPDYVCQDIYKRNKVIKMFKQMFYSSINILKKYLLKKHLKKFSYNVLFI